MPDGRHLIIATELEDNTGTSITNVAEKIATQVIQEFDIDRKKLVWVEHYPVRNHYKETYDLVEFSWDIRNACFSSPQWYRMEDEDWESLGVKLKDLKNGNLPST